MLVCPPIHFPLSLSLSLPLSLRRYGSGWVVTQAALNGVARYAGHALQIMALVRPAAPSAFEGLRQLVDLYVYCAFTLFCPQWAIDGECLWGSDTLSSSSSSSCRRRRSLRVVLCPRVLVEYSKCQVITTVVHISGTRAVAYQLRGHFRGMSWVHW